MSTDLYNIKVLEKTSVEVKLRVTIVYEDTWDTPNADAKGFFLMVLWDNVWGYGERPNAPLGDAISIDDITSWEFRRDNETQFIAAVERLESHNFPVEDNPAYEADEWDYDQLPYTDYRLTVTDARWIAHVEPGQSWGTTAYEGRGY